MSKEAALALAAGTELTTAPETVATETSKAIDSDRFASLSKKEADFVKRQQDLKREREQFQAERDQFKPIAEQYNQYKATKEKDPVGALKILGFSETDIINYLAAQDKGEPTESEKAAQAATEATQAEIKKFKDEQDKAAKDAQTKRDQDVIEGFKGQIGKVIEGDKSKFEYCAHYGAAAEELAYDLTLEVVKTSGGKEIITAQEAAEMVEEYYEEQDKLMMTLKKRQPKAAPEAETKKEPERTRTVTPGDPSGEKLKPPISRTRTLTNAATATVASTRHRQNETKEQKRERLMEALRSGKLDS